MYSKSSSEQMFSSYSSAHLHIWLPGQTQTVSRVSSEEGWREAVVQEEEEEEGSEGEYSADEMETTKGWV